MIRNELKEKLELIEIQIEIMQNRAAVEEITAALSGQAKKYKDRWQSPNDALEFLKPARQMYRNLGVDPTRYRPASEALLRRAVKGKEMPGINAAVDAANYISLHFLLPLGLYDRTKIRGNIVLRSGLADEVYEGLGKPEVRLAGKYVLADDIGPFGNPSSDSLRTSVDLDCKQLLLVVYTPKDDIRKVEIIEETNRIYNFLRN